MPDLLSAIETRLNTPDARGQLTPLFCETLLWGRPQAATFTRNVRLDAEQQVDLTFIPTAQLSGLPVFRVDWPAAALPTVAQRRAVHRALAPTYLEHLLVYVAADSRQLAFVWARQRSGQADLAARVEMRTLPYSVGAPARTTLEQLSALAFTLEELGLFGAPPVTAVTDKLNAAFDVEAVTRRFFKTYADLFSLAEREITGIDAEARRLFTQKLFNRLMFLVFLERKGWLRFGASSDYLRELWQDYRRERQTDPAINFYRDRLKLLFFSGLNTPNEADVVGIRRDDFLHTRIGHVPYLNGGLFEEDAEDRDLAIGVPDAILERALDDLFYRFNFTVTESTPLDVEVAVDPEMLGQIFEELVTGRHESGSYYTPKPVVAFMGREALKGYLRARCPQETPRAVAAFVDERDPGALANHETVLEALKQVTVCDPACGSGAYLVGMLHELLDLRLCLFSARGLDAQTIYTRKLDIIQRNLYGVDRDRFAVNIARLRLWLSLMVDFEGASPEPLPNLDFKIETGDSLTAPDPSGGLQPDLFRYGQVQDYFRLKGAYMQAHHGEKLTLRGQIDALRAEIAAWAHPDGVAGFDWQVEFAEVFAPELAAATLRGRMPGVINAGGGQMESTAPPVAGGFDIVLANPPYVRADAPYHHIADESARQAAIARWQAYRQQLKASKIYRTLYEKWDLYIPFLERAYQLLSPGGQMVFIIPDAYNAAKYALKSHEFFLENVQIVRLDFCSEIPLFTAGVSNTILHFTRAQPTAGHTLLRFRRWGDSPDDFEENVTALPATSQASFGRTLFRADRQKAVPQNRASVPLEMICYISVGMVIHADERQHQGEFDTEDVLSDVPDEVHSRKFVLGKDVLKWTLRNARYLEWNTVRAPAHFRRPTFPELYEAKEKLLAVRTPGAVPKVIYDDEYLHFDASSVGFIPWHYLKDVVNRSIDKTAKYRQQSPEGDREEREALSQQFHPKYLLAVMNSAFARDWLARQRRSKLHVYPNDWKQLPIASIMLEEQLPFVSLVDAILAEFAQHGVPLPPEAAARVAAWEAELNALVYQVYALTAADIAQIEGG